MKKLSALIASLLVAVASFGQGTAIRSQSGIGTNTTIINGLTLNPTLGAPANTGITNVGPLVIRLGAGVLGTQLNFIGTNGVGIVTYVGDTFSINSDLIILNGASGVRVPVTNAFLSGDSNGKITARTDAQSLTNVQNAAITNTASTLASTGNQTNYTVTLLPNGAKYFLYTANTNVNITFAGLAAGNGASVFVNAITSSANATVTLPSSLLTNVNYVNVVTNGFGQWYNYESIDGTSSNITVIGGGPHRR